MHVIALLAQKGGVGKTTLALHWAVEAAREHYKKVVIIDMDPQASASRWYQRRKRASPILLRADGSNVAKAVAACRTDAVDLVLIDTRAQVERSSVVAARLADLAVLPCGPSVLDIEALAQTVNIVKRAETRAVIVINRGRHSSNINATAATVLKQYELPVCPALVMSRAALEDVFIAGRAISELRPKSKAAQEITVSWQWIAHQLQHQRDE